PDGKVLATAGSQGVQLWDSSSGRRLAALTPEGTLALAVAFHPSGSKVAALVRQRIEGRVIPTGKDRAPAMPSIPDATNQPGEGFPVSPRWRRLHRVPQKGPAVPVPDSMNVPADDVPVQARQLQPSAPRPSDNPTKGAVVRPVPQAMNLPPDEIPESAFPK